MKYIINTEPIELGTGANGYIEQLLRLRLLIPASVEEWPKEGNTYYFLDSYSVLNSDTYYNNKIDKWRIATGNMFRTEAEAMKFREDTLKGSK